MLLPHPHVRYFHERDDKKMSRGLTLWNKEVKSLIDIWTDKHLHQMLDTRGTERSVQLGLVKTARHKGTRPCCPCITGLVVFSPLQGWNRIELRPHLPGVLSWVVLFSECSGCVHMSANELNQRGNAPWFQINISNQYRRERTLNVNCHILVFTSKRAKNPFTMVLHILF